MVITQERVIIGSAATCFDNVVWELACTAHATGAITNCEEFVKSVYAREAEASTNCGQGIGTPHGKSSAVVTPFVAFAQMKQPIVWGAPEDEKVSIAFMIGVPEENKDNIHLKIISSIFRRLVDEELLNALKSPDLTDCRVLELLSLGSI